jgi:exosortase A-associated hydrolase 1
MRRLTTFTCEGETLAASLDDAGGTTGLLLVIGGSQTRIGSHRMYERLAKALTEKGFPCFRYDRRGVGDSSGEDPGFRGSGPDLTAATAAFRVESPTLARIVGFGLCDGASALALFGGEAELDGLILVNPWLVETADEDSPPAAAIRHYYWKRLTSREGWTKILTGAVNWRKLLRGVRKAAAPLKRAPLAGDVADALRASTLPVRLILAEGDATAIAAQAELKAAAFDGLIAGRETLATDSHTFARPGDEAALLAAVERALAALAPHAS